jgi:hypothetical protein
MQHAFWHGSFQASFETSPRFTNRRADPALECPWPREKTDTGRIWTYVRDDRPFGGLSSPAALYYASRDRRQEHPERHLKIFTGILQADAYGGYSALFSRLTAMPIL